MTNLQIIADTVELARYYFNDLLYQSILDRRYGIKDCSCECGCVDKKDFLHEVIEATQFQLDNQLSNGMTELFYETLLDLVGNYKLADKLPVVNAGIDQTIQLPTSSVIFNATVTVTSNPIQSTVWTQITGPNTATLTNASTTSLTASNLIQGNYVFRITIVDTKGNTTYDEATTVVQAAAIPQINIQWGYSATNLNSNPSAFSPQFNQQVQQNSNYSMNFTSSADQKYLIVKVPSTENTKTTWYNTAFNNGTIPDQAFYTVQTIGGFKYYTTRLFTIDSTNSTILLS